MIFLLLASLAFGLLQAENFNIQSSYLEYKTNTLHLSQNVSLELDLGTLFADEATVFSEKPNDEVSAYYIHLNGNVKLFLKDGGQIECSSADIDPVSRMATFHSNAEQEFVTYTEINDSNPFVLKSRNMAAALTPADNSIKYITAEKDVTVMYKDLIKATAPKASFQRHELTEAAVNHRLPGTLILEMDEQIHCEVTHGNGDFISANRIEIDTINRQMAFTYPTGTLYPKGLNTTVSQPLSFSCDSLVWNDREQILKLSGHIDLSQDNMGTLANEDRVFIYLNEKNKQLELKTIQTYGKTIFRYFDPNKKERSQTITCYGTCILDHENGLTLMNSPHNSAGNVVESKQILIKDDIGELYADKITLYYTHQDQKINPSKIDLEGNVKIFNHSFSDPAKTKIKIEYALADTMEYLPEKKEVWLSGTNNKRVLFFDRINNLQVSATSLKIYRDQTTNRESVQGFGDVRFNFIKREVEEMQNQFRHFNSEIGS